MKRVISMEMMGLKARARLRFLRNLYVGSVVISSQHTKQSQPKNSCCHNIGKSCSILLGSKMMLCFSSIIGLLFCTSRTFRCSNSNDTCAHYLRGLHSALKGNYAEYKYRIINYCSIPSSDLVHVNVLSHITE
eukprot:TRINITY_DN11342_c0_g1_i7.p1 TRINITY_DN11342_c0_g1~~TRINITY_DN11342_c0_g1_i7.p1  ORF type:complete len:133 (-),score=1.66 TRINITY_DN11342_c0_g1_i7:296-694(-)